MAGFLALAPGALAAAQTAAVPALPPEVVALEEQARQLQIARHFQEALAPGRRALELAIADPHLDPVSHAGLLEELAQSELFLGQLTDAEGHYRQALELREGAEGLLSPDLVTSLEGVAVALAGEHRPAEAEPLLLRAEGLAGGDTPQQEMTLMTVLNALGNLYVMMGRFDDSDRIVKKMAALGKSLMPQAESAPGGGAAPPAHDSAGAVAESSVDEVLKLSLGSIEKVVEENEGSPESSRMRLLGRWIQALFDRDRQRARVDDDLRQAVSIAAASFGEESGEAASARTGLASWQIELGQVGAARGLFRQALEVLDAHPELPGADEGYALEGLALVAELSGQPRQAADLYGRAVVVFRERLGDPHPFVANAIFKQARALFRVGDVATSRQLEAAAAALYERVLPADHPFRGRSLPDRRIAYDGIERLAPIMDAADRLNLRNCEETAGGSATQVADLLVEQAFGYTWSARYPEARPRLERALAIREAALGALHPSTLDVRLRLAYLDRSARRAEKALPNVRSLTDAVQSRLLLAEQPDDQDPSVREQRSGRAAYLAHLGFLVDIYGPGLATRPALREEAFAQSQLAVASRTAQSLRATVVRMAAAGGDRGRLAGRLQQLAERRDRIDGDLLKDAGLPAAQRDVAAEARLRGERAAVAAALAATGTRLARTFPRYAHMLSPRPVTLAAVQRTLGAREAMLFFVVDTAASYVWAVRRHEVGFATLPGQQVLQDQVTRLRRSLRLSEVEQELANGQVPSFDIADAAALGRELLAGVRSRLAGADHLVLVLDGPLAALPCAALLTGTKNGSGATALAQQPWLVREFSLSVVPAVGSLTDLRSLHGPSRAPRPFLGIGRPVLEGAAAPSAGFGDGSNDALAASRALRNTAELREAALELEEIASALGSPHSELKLGVEATKAVVSALPLQRFRTIAFATHGFAPGEGGAGDGAEPALLLSAARGEVPSQSRLTASEIAQLQLDADLVLLSACNTAAPDGRPEGEMLSGLARSFLLAGSRSLLVSHWAVPSVATSYLTVAVFRSMRRRHLGVARALRRAMLQMMGSRDHPEFAHPVYWGAFVVVGQHETVAR